MAATAIRRATHADQLREQARALERAADRLRDERMELLRESWSLVHEAERLESERPALTTVAEPTAAETDADLLGRVCEFLETGEGEWSSSDVAEHLAITQGRARAALTRLERIGMVARTGIKRGTRYRLTVEEEAPTPTVAETKVREFGNYRTLVRDAVIKLGTFGFVDLQRELPDLSEGTLRRWLRTLEDEGHVESVRAEGRNVYAYMKPEGTTPARPKRATPEQEATRMAALAPARATVAGTGRAVRSGASIVDALIREVRPYGVEVTFSAHRVEYRKDGRIIATSSKTPGASSLKGTRGELRRAGVPV